MKSSITSDSASSVTDEDVRAALANIVVSPAFRASPQLASFLRFVIEAALNGESDRIKGYTIAVEALGRDERFDPQTDPIVRVEAGRLRRALDRYYDGPGKNDAIVIDLPRGSYVPTVRRRKEASPADRPGWAFARLLASPSLRWANLVIPAVVILSLVAHAGMNWFGTESRSPEQQSARAAASSSATSRSSSKLNTGPSIMIERVTSAGEPTSSSITAAAIEARLRDAFARYDDVTVMAREASSDNIDAPGRRGATRSQVVDYRLVSGITYQADATVTFKFQLVDTTDGSIAWSRSIERVKVASDPGITEAAVVRDVATTLLQQYGVIYSRELRKYTADPHRDPHFACLLKAYEYLRSYDQTRFWPVRRCLEKAVAEDPTFASGYAALAQIFRREYLYDLGSDGDTPPLDRALEMARRAVELQPNHVRAHYVLLDVHMARGEFAEAMAAGEKAIALNPYDTAALFRYGTQLIFVGEIDRGVKLVNEAAAYLPAMPPRYHATLAIAAYLKGDAATASAHANQITNDGIQLGLVARILAAQISGDHARAAQAVSRLAALRPQWPTNPRRELKKYFHIPWILERVVNDVTAAGLGARPAPAAAAGTPLPMIYVEPFAQLGSRPSGSYDPTWIRVQLVQALARFDDVTIASQDSTASPDNASGAPPRADYRLAASVSYDGTGGMALSIRLIDGANGTALWTKTYEHLRPAESGTGGALPIIAQVSATLLHPFGVVPTQERLKPLRDGPGAERYRCLLQSNEYLRSFTPALYAKAQACLEHAIATDPQFAPAFVALARIYLREYEFGTSPEKDEAPLLDRAQQLAERAIEINPSSARAHFVMFDVLGARGDAVGVRRFGEKAIALNPNDPPVVFHYAAQLIMLGDIDRGVDLIRRVMALSTIPPARLDFAMFMASYLKQDLPAAAHYANRISNESFTPGLVARALVEARSNEAAPARRAIERLIAIEPRWRDNPRGELRKFISSPAVVDEFAHDLEVAGLVPAGQTASEGRPSPRGVLR